MKKVQQIVSAFDIKGKASAVQPFGNGHINDTFRVITEGDDTPDYVLQRINHHIFRNVDMLMNNIIAVTDHIRKKLEQQGVKDLDRRVLRFLPTREGKYYHFDGESYWRLMICIADSESFDVVDAKYSHFAGLAFGEFQNMLADIPIKLGETIPNFHNMEFRLEEFREAVRSNRAGRANKVSDLIDGIEQRAEAMCEGERLYRAGLLPKRICHCDTKVNNILFDREGRVLCVIDLDTVMPNFIFSDYGDFLRTAANTALRSIYPRLSRKRTFSHRHRDFAPSLCRCAFPLYADRAIPGRLPQWRHLLQDCLSRAQHLPRKGTNEVAPERRREHAQDERVHCDFDPINNIVPIVFIVTIVTI